ncbi:hypothetical protein C8F01DRAFT_258665 [Mycena amicta]|nr:hypothetical protein C8F01DRAFT_258665 [Mycena amicta]
MMGSQGHSPIPMAPRQTRLKKNWPVNTADPFLMAPQSRTHPPVFVLCFPNAVRVAGETIQGRVELDVNRAQQDGVDDVRINLEGSIITTILETNADGSDTKHQCTVQLINSTKSLWQRGAELPVPGSHILALPFEFQLPETLPPTFHFSVPHHEALISYSVEIVGSRPGLLRKDRRIRKTFPVLPAASPAQIAAKKSLKQGWNGAYKTTVLEQRLRQGVWGDFSHARVEVKMPKLSSLPRATAIPLQLMVETRTKCMLRSDAPFDKFHKPLFPAPPTKSAEVKVHLYRETRIRTQRRSGTRNDCVRMLGSLGDPESSSVQSAEWIPHPEKLDRGVWKRTVQFYTTVYLPFAPTFFTETVDCAYLLRFTVPFPGIDRNNLKLHVPIHLAPSHASPPTANINYAFIPPDELPPPPY